MADTGPLSAALEEIRAEASVSGPRFADVRRLLAAVDKVLDLADKWDRDAYRTAAYAAAGCAEQVREAITRELLGEETGNG